MAIIRIGVYTPGHKPEPSLHERLSNFKMAAPHPKEIEPGCFALPLKNDATPLPFVKGGSFANDAEKLAAHKNWLLTYQETGA